MSVPVGDPDLVAVERSEEPAKKKLIDIDAWRQRVPLFDHVFRAAQHYGAANGSMWAAAITYFGFLSLFPILALAFATVGLVAQFVPELQQVLETALENILPGMIGDDPNQISLSSIQNAAGAVAGVGAITVLYAGLHWVNQMRDALAAMFEVESSRAPSMVSAKVRAYAKDMGRDIFALFGVGFVLLFSVVVSGGLIDILERFRQGAGIDSELSIVGSTVLIAVGIAAGAVLFFAMFKVLAVPDLPNRSLWSGAILGAIGFELLKQASKFLLTSTANQPAFQSFGIALILLVWIYYFSRLVMFAAAWAKTAETQSEDAADHA